MAAKAAIYISKAIAFAKIAIFRTLLTLLLYVGCGQALGYGQLSSFTLYNEKDGLPAGFVTAVFKDSRGIIWVGTTNGLCRFDGRNFTTYGLPHGIPDLHVKYVNEHEDGSLVVGFHQVVCHFDGRRFTPVLQNKNSSDGFYYYKKHCYHDKSTAIIINGTHYRWQNGRYEPLQVTVPSPFTAWVICGPDTVFAATDGSVLIGDAQQRRQVLQATGQLTSFHFLQKDSLLLVQKSGLYCFSRGRFWKVMNLSVNTPYDVLDVTVAGERYIWMSFEGFGTLCLDWYTKNAWHYHSKNSPLSNFDKPINFGDASVWFASSHGVIKAYESAYTMYNQKFDISLSNIQGFFAAGNQSFLLAAANSLMHLQYTNGHLQPPKVIGQLPAGEGIIHLCRSYNNHNYLLTNRISKLYRYHGKGTGITPAHDLNEAIAPRLAGVRGYYSSSLQSVLFAQSGKVWQIGPQGKLTKIPVTGADSPYLRGFTELSGGAVWGIHLDGVCKLVNKQFVPVKLIPALPPTAEIISIAAVNDTLWLGTLTDGLYGITEQNHCLVRVVHVHEKNGLWGNSVYKLMNDADGDVWMITNRGLQCLRQTPEGRRPVAVHIPGYKYEGLLYAGLQTDSVGQVWFYNTHSLLSIKRRQFKQSVPPPKVFLTAIAQADSFFTGKFTPQQFCFTPPDQVVLPHYKNSLTIGFSAISYAEEGVQYRYRLAGAENGWNNNMTDEEVVYTGLAPGTYTFEVSAATPGGPYGAPAIFSFTITPPFYKTWWFYWGSGLLLFLLLLALYSQKVQKLKAENAQKMQQSKRMAQLHMQSLQAQLNPHFIFNALNSIQDYILSHNATEASRYLSRFAKLIRLMLDNSSRNILPVSEVADMMNRYLELESLRMDEDFEYSIAIEENLDAYHTGVPLMMVQPYVENAIWHGLMPKNGKKLLTIRIAPVLNGISISIEDNGVGRMQAAQKQKAHKSVGAQLAHESFEALSALLNLKADLTITDKLDAEGRAAGTIVTIILPQINIQHAG